MTGNVLKKKDSYRSADADCFSLNYCFQGHNVRVRYVRVLRVRQCGFTSGEFQWLRVIPILSKTLAVASDLPEKFPFIENLGFDCFACVNSPKEQDTDRGPLRAEIRFVAHLMWCTMHFCRLGSPSLSCFQ